MSFARVMIIQADCLPYFNGNISMFCFTFNIEVKITPWAPRLPEGCVMGNFRRFNVSIQHPVFNTTYFEISRSKSRVSNVVSEDSHSRQETSLFGVRVTGLLSVLNRFQTVSNISKLNS